MGQSAFDGTFVQFLHCHLSFVRFAAQEVGFQKNITCFGRKVLRKVQIADGFIRRQALILLRAVPGSQRCMSNLWYPKSFPRLRH